MERAVFGGGCFWCLEAVYAPMRGVLAATSGYCGGSQGDAHYNAVCSARTDHAEVVAIDFEQELISYADLLRIFFAIHDPTTLDRQGNDVGRQYRSVIFCQDAAQMDIAKTVIAEVADTYGFTGKIVTELAEAHPFYAAEDEHQRYFERNPHTGYCAFIVGPKVAKARSMFAQYLK